MVYPVSNPLVQQQIPAANTFQPGGTESTKRPEENKTEDSTRPSGSDTARAEAAATRRQERADQSDAYYQAKADDRAQDNGAASTNSSRGTHLDLSA
jgi:hypothetical protein